MIEQVLSQGRERVSQPDAEHDFAAVGSDDDLSETAGLHAGKLAECAECQWALARLAEAKAVLLERRADRLDGLGEANDARNLEIWRQTVGR